MTSIGSVEILVRITDLKGMSKDEVLTRINNAMNKAYMLALTKFPMVDVNLHEIDITYKIEGKNEEKENGQT